MKKFLSMPTPLGLSAACNVKHSGAKFQFTTSKANPVISDISSNGATTVTSITNGKKHTEEFPNGFSSATLVVSADANTVIKINGQITVFKPRIGYQTTAWLTSFKCISQYSITEIDLSNNLQEAQLDTFVIQDCPNLSTLVVDSCNIKSLDLSGMVSLRKLSCSHNSSLAPFDSSECTALEEIRCVDSLSSWTEVYTVVQKLPVFSSGVHEIYVSNNVIQYISDTASSKGWTAKGGG